MGYNLDQRSVSSLIYDKDVRPFIKGRISNKFFKNSSARAAYAWIRKYHEKYNVVPSKSLFKEQFPNYELKRPGDPVDFLVESLITRHSRKLLLDALGAVGEALSTEGPQKALAILTNSIERIQLNSNRTSDLAISDDIDESVTRYKTRRDTEGIAGVPYGFDPLDEQTDGMLPGQLGLIFGDTGVGKSWIAVIIAFAAWLSGVRVLYITKENLDIEISNRVIALFCRISPFRLRTGQLTPWEEKKLYRLSGLIKKMGKTFIISAQDDIEGASLGTAGVRQKIQQYKPDIVIVDGLYLMEEEDVRGAEWQSLRTIAYRLKRVARKENVHILAVTQSSGEGASQEQGATSASHIAFSRGIGMACDTMINVYENEELVTAGCKGVKLIKQREGEKVNFVITFDFDNCGFNVMEQETSVDELEPDLPT